MNALDQELAESLYIINKEAKQHSTRAESYKASQQHTRAKKHKQITDELYRVKTATLESLSDCSTHTELHTISQHKYYCFYFEDTAGTEWSFHMPTSATDNSYAVDDQQNLTEFTPSQTATKSDMSLETALQVIEQSCSIVYSGPELQLHI